MSYSTMTTRSAGYVVPASEYNQFIANDEACAVAQFTAAGDLFYGTASKAGARLAKGTFGQVLRQNAALTGPEWGQPAFIQAALYNTPQTTTTETTIVTVSIPANFLFGGSAKHAVMLDSYFTILNSYTGAVTVTWKLYYGATPASTGALSFTNGDAKWGVIVRGVIESIDNSNQYMLVTAIAGGSSNMSAHSGLVTPTIDSTQAQTAKLTVTLSVATGSFAMHTAYASLIPAVNG